MPPEPSIEVIKQDYRLDLTAPGPQGPAGPRGERGPAGPQGPPGAGDGSGGSASRYTGERNIITSWRDSLLNVGDGSNCYELRIDRRDDRVTLRGYLWAAPGNRSTPGFIPSGFMPRIIQADARFVAFAIGASSEGNVISARIDSNGTLRLPPSPGGDGTMFEISWTTKDDWPADLPGTPYPG